MKTMAVLLLAMGIFLAEDTARADEENLPGIEPALFEQVDTTRKSWEEAQGKYMESMTTAMKRLREAIIERTERLVHEELPLDARKTIYSEVKALEERYQHLDDEENMLQAASIVKWANRKEELQQFLSSSKRAITGAAGLTERS